MQSQLDITAAIADNPGYDLNLADPAVYHAWQQDIATAAGVRVADVDAVAPCGCDWCRNADTN